MPTPSETLIDLEIKFWQSIVDHDTDSAVEMLSEPALMVSAHGAVKFDRQTYRKLADRGPTVLKAFELSKIDVVFPNDSTAILTYHAKQEIAPRGNDERTVQEMNDTSTWVKDGDDWRCVMHTETLADARAAH